METTVAEGYTSYNIGMILIAVALIALSVTLVVSGIIGYRRSREAVERGFAAVAIVGGLSILATMVSGMAELLPEAALWPLLFFEMGILSILFWVWMLVDCAIKEPNAGNVKLVWVLIILFTHVLGAALYLSMRRPRRLAEVGR